MYIFIICERTSTASRFASKVTLLAVESEEGGIDDRNLRTLLSSSVDKTFVEGVDDMMESVGC